MARQKIEVKSPESKKQKQALKAKKRTTEETLELVLLELEAIKKALGIDD